MENSDAVDMSSESLESQYTLVATETDLSKVMQFGQMTFTQEPIGDFQGDLEVATQSDSSYSSYIGKWFDDFKEAAIDELEKQLAPHHKHPKITVDSRDASLNFLYNEVIRDPSM
jgi:hypothetical protein